MKSRPERRDRGGAHPSGLPCHDELAALYAAYRERYFQRASPRSARGADGVLEKYHIPPVQEVCIEWSARLTSSAGICYPRRRVIRLSTHYHERFPSEVGPTLLHEMIHLVVPGHGADFHRWLQRISDLGGTVHRYSRERAAPPRWEYVCPRCRRRYPRTRRLPGQGRKHRCRYCQSAGGPLQEVGPLT